MVQVQEYLTGNSTIRYPFKFGTTLVSSNSGLDLTDTFLLEGLLVFKVTEAKKAYLKAFYNDTGAQVFHFTIEVLDALGSVIATELFQIPFADVTELGTFTTTNDTFYGKFVGGAGLLATKTSVSNNSSYTLAATEFSPSAIILAMPKVTSVQFYNMNEANEPTLLVSVDSTTLTLKEGTNLSFLNDSGQFVFNVVPGAGAGKHNPCGETDEIRAINGLKADSNQNFFITGGSCYVINPDDEEPHTLNVMNVCNPSCSTEQINAYAYYLNRVADGMNDIIGLASSVRTDINDIIAEYFNETLPLINSPSYKIKFLRTITANGCSVYSFSVAINNPTDEVFEFEVSAEVTEDQSLTSGTFQVGNAVDEVETVHEYSGSLPCKSQGILTFSIRPSEDCTFTLSISDARLDGENTFSLTA